MVNSITSPVQQVKAGAIDGNEIILAGNIKVGSAVSNVKFDQFTRKVHLVQKAL